MIKDRKSRGQYERSDLIGQDLRSLIKIDGFGRTRPGALLALLFIQKQAVLRIYGVGGRGCLSIRNVDGLPVGEIFIIGVWNWNRTIGSANPACRAFLFIHVARLFAYHHLEVPGISRNLLHRGIGDDFDVGMSGRLNESGGENSDGTIIGGKGLVQSGHDAAYG
jgi:hypothetical protein